MKAHQSKTGENIHSKYAEIYVTIIWKHVKPKWRVKTDNVVVSFKDPAKNI